MWKFKIYTFNGLAVFTLRKVEGDRKPDRQIVYNSSELSICEIYLRSKKGAEGLAASLICEGVQQL
jgi:hypothetical protein